MKSFDLQPTDENILEVFLQDMIGRNKDVSCFVSLLDSIEDSCSIALDGQWGSGKTFFVKQVQMVMNAFNGRVSSHNSDTNEQIKQKLQIIGSKETDIQPQVTVYYDAWVNDNDEDPILSLIYEILHSVKSEYSFKKGPEWLRIAASIFEFFSGKKVNTIIDALKSEDPFASLKTNRDIHKLIDEFLISLLAEQGNRLVVIIDELDRCKPSYAVQLLERIKHYFSNDRVTFVFSINIDELLHTVKRYYGDGFNSGRYLDRFFDLRIKLPPANMRLFYKQFGLENERYVYERVCTAVIKANNFTLREIAKFYRLAKIAAYKPTHGGRYHNDQALYFCLSCIVPIMIGLMISDPARYELFAQGKDSSPLYDVMKYDQLALGSRNALLSTEETYGEKQDEKEIVVSLQDKLQEVYNALFLQDYESGNYEKHIGEMSIDRNTRETLFQTVSLLSDYADYKI